MKNKCSKNYILSIKLGLIGLGAKIFDITVMVCPLCKKTHSVKRVGFNLYEVVCTIHEKQFNLVLNNWQHKKYYDWVKWIK
jgi:transposase-like protein